VSPHTKSHIRLCGVKTALVFAVAPGVVYFDKDSKRVNVRAATA
jgi:hypothetical protein